MPASQLWNIQKAVYFETLINKGSVFQDSQCEAVCSAVYDDAKAIAFMPTKTNYNCEHTGK